MALTKEKEEQSKKKDTTFKQHHNQVILPESKDLIQKVIINATMMSFSVGYTMAYFNAFKFEDMMQIFHLTMEKSFGQGLLTGCIPIGACFGAILCKLYLNKFSRKQCFYILNVISSLSILLIQTKILNLVFLGRIMQGSFVGSGLPIVALYIKQFIPQMNGKYGFYKLFSLTSGMIWAFGFNFILNLIFSDSQKYWRINFIFPLIISIFQTYNIKYHYNYETPRYLISKEKFQDSKKLLSILYKKQHAQKQFQGLYEAVFSKKIEFEQNNVQKPDCKKISSQRNLEQIEQIQANIQLNNFDSNESLSQEKKNQEKNILSNQKKDRKLSHPLAVFCAVHLSFQRQILGIGIVVHYSGDIVRQFYPSIFYYYGAIVHIFGLLCICIGLKLVQRYGRVFLYQTGSLIIFFLLILIGANFLLKDYGSKWSIIISVILLRGVFSTSLGALYWLYMAEIVKPNVIPYGAFINELTSTLVIFLFPIVNQILGGPGWIFIFNGLICGLSILINHFTLVESKGKNQLIIWEDFETKLVKLKSSKLFKLFLNES